MSQISFPDTFYFAYYALTHGFTLDFQINLTLTLASLQWALRFLTEMVYFFRIT